MVLQASEGRFLTESYEVPIKDRQFLSQVNVANLDEAALWKEITEIEKESMIVQAQLFEVDGVSYEYLTKVDTLLSGIAEKINDAHLSADEALWMRKYYPHWEDKMGEDVATGFRMQRGGYLFEVIVPHRVSAETDPLMQASTLPAEDVQQGYYKLVTGDVELYNNLNK